MAGVKYHQAHAQQHTLVHSLDNGIIHALMSNMSPPGENVRLGQDVVSKPVRIALKNPRRRAAVERAGNGGK